MGISTIMHLLEKCKVISNKLKQTCMSNDVKHTEKYRQEWPIKYLQLYQTGEIEIEQ